MMQKAALVLALIVAFFAGGRQPLAASRAPAALRLGDLPPRVASGGQLEIALSVSGASAGSHFAAVTLLLAERAPRRWKVPVKVDKAGQGAASLTVEMPKVSSRVRVDIVASLGPGTKPDTRRLDILPAPGAEAMAAVCRGRLIGLSGVTAPLRHFLAPYLQEQTGSSHAPVLDLGESIRALRGFNGDLLVINTPSDYTVTDEYISAVHGLLASGRSVIWLSGPNAYAGPSFRSPEKTINQSWPVSLSPQAGLPDLQPGDLSGWPAIGKIAAPLESCYLGARLIWASDALLTELNAPTADPAASWLLYDLLYRSKMPVKSPALPVKVRARAVNSLSLPALGREAADFFRRPARAHAARPIVFFSDAATLSLLNKEFPGWDKKLHGLLEVGGMVIIIHTENDDLSFLAGTGLRFPRLRPVAPGWEAVLQPSPLLWGIPSPEAARLQAPARFALQAPNGRLTLLQIQAAGPGRLLVLTFDPSATDLGDRILHQLLRSLSSQ